MPANTGSTDQTSTTIRKPSRTLSSRVSLRAVHHSPAPMPKVTRKASS
jgi:hypothetical protein